MVEQVSRILRGLSFEDFVRQVRESLVSSPQPLEWAAAAVRETAASLYRGHYESFVPQSLMALAGALAAGRFLPVPRRLLPVVQAVWYSSHEEKLPSYPVNGIPSLPRLPDPAEITARLTAGDFESVLAALGTAAERPEGFAAISGALISSALRDTAHQGQKLIYLQKSLELTDALGAAEAKTVLFPAVHFMALARSDFQYHEILTLKLAQDGRDPGAWLENRAPLTPEEALRLSRVLIYQYPALIIENLVYELNQGISVADLFEAVLLSAAEVLLGAYPEQGAAAAQGVHFAYAARDCFGRVSAPPDKISLLFMSALFLNKMAVRSLNPHKVLKLEEVDLSGEISPVALEGAIERSDSRQAGALAIRMAATADPAALAETLAFAAAKNDGNVSGGHDLRLCSEMLLPASPPPSSGLSALCRAASLKALSYFLAQLDKDYDLYKACGIL